MPIEHQEWDGLIRGRTDPGNPLVIEVPLQPSPNGGSGTFLAEASDKHRWWVKPLNNLQGPKVIVTEYIVGWAGAVIIGAPVCEVTAVRIPEDISGWEFRPGARLEPGLACASRAIDDAQEVRALEYRDRDENAVRHAGVYALYDWCWGGDDQWLYCETDDRKLYSHDHGYYFPDTGPDWSEATLLAHVDEPHPARYPTTGVDPQELSRLAVSLTQHPARPLLDAIRNLGADTEKLDELVNSLEPLRKRLAEMLLTVPASWPVTDGELAALGFFLERRAPGVAQRLTAMIGGS